MTHPKSVWVKFLVFLQHFWIDIIISAALVTFSSWLMFSTFSYNTKPDAMVVAVKAWSDFGAHIPMIRSFSLGDNLTKLLHFTAPEYPLFPGEPIRYHFIFYAFVGILEKIGVRIDWALNIPSILGFAGLLIGLYFLAKTFFKDRRVGLLTVLFALFNSSLTFINYFKEHSLSELPKLQSFISFAPWGKGDITAFWSLNIFTNQRHLAFAFALVVFFILTVYKSEDLSLKKQLRNLLPWGVIFGFLPFFHQPTLIMLAIIMACYVLLFPKLRTSLYLTGAITTVLVLLQIPLLMGSKGFFAFVPGFLIAKPFTLGSTLIYWWHNLGLQMILIPLGFFIIPRSIKRYFIPIFLIFLVGYCFQFSRELAGNHKFFNFYLILGGMVTAHLIVKIVKNIGRIKGYFKLPLYLIPVLLVVLLTFSGIVDLFPIINDGKLQIADVTVSKEAKWFKDNTSPDSVILTANNFNHPASIAGRKIYLGWPYFAWSAGYDTDTRFKSYVKPIYAATNRTTLCKLLIAQNISYVTFERGGMEDVYYSEYIFQKSFPKVLEIPEDGFKVYQTKDYCY